MCGDVMSAGNEHSEGIKTSKAITAQFLRTVCFRKQEVCNSWFVGCVQLACRMLLKERPRLISKVKVF
jgi:hypothetical protein